MEYFFLSIVTEAAKTIGFRHFQVKTKRQIYGNLSIAEGISRDIYF